METTFSYCDMADTPFHGPYHNAEYGFPVTDDNALFERLCLEINQAGLSWLTAQAVSEPSTATTHLSFAVPV